MKRKKIWRGLALNAVSNSFIIILMVLLCSCSKPGTEDLRLLDEIGRNFENKYKLSFNDDLYIIVRAIGVTKISYEDMLCIYKEFIFIDFSNKIKRDTSFVYLNTYSSDGNFQYQIYFDRQKNEFVKTKADFY